MKTFVLTFTIFLAIKVIWMIIKFGIDELGHLKRDDAAWLLLIRLLLFIWGLVLLIG